MEGHVVNVFDLNTVPRAHVLCSVPCPSGVQRFHVSSPPPRCSGNVPLQSSLPLSLQSLLPLPKTRGRLMYSFESGQVILNPLNPPQ